MMKNGINIKYLNSINLYKIMKERLKIFSLLILLTLITTVYAIEENTQSLTETYKTGIPITLPFSCTINGGLPSNSAILNISLQDKSGGFLLQNIQTTPLGNGAFYYNYTFVNTGLHKVTIFCLDGLNNGSTEAYYNITPSGNSGNSNDLFFVFLIVLIYAVTLIGFFGRNVIVSLLGGMFMMALGLYAITQGVIIYRDWITNYFSYLTIAIGVYISIVSGIALINGDY
jgi:hypothetical protein